MNGLLKLFRDHEQLNQDENKETSDKFEEHQKTLRDLQSQIDKNATTQIKDKADTDTRREAVELRFDKKMEKQFQDFILKIDSELTRRNRLRIEAFNKFAQMEELLDAMQGEISVFEQN